MPLRRTKRKMETAALTPSTSGTDSDEVYGSLTRTKKPRVVSEYESSKSAEVIFLESENSDADSENSDWASHPSDANLSPATPKPTFEGNSKCSICLLPFTDQLVGTPQSCDHPFCLNCIREWSKIVNTCPVDRKIINIIDVRACLGGPVLRKELVKGKQRC